MENLIYLVKVNLYWIILYACFWLFFRRHTFFSLNRFYLLSTLLLAIFLPLITIPQKTTEKISDVVYNISLNPVLQNEIPQSDQSMRWVLVLFTIYLAGVVFLSITMFIGFNRLFWFIKNGDNIVYEDYTLVLLPKNINETDKMGSFSFFKWLMISNDDYENYLENVLRHEMVHIRQKHSVDIVIVEILKIIFWFNPVLWLYKTSLQQIHEFLADASADDREDYATFLISYSFNAPVQSLSNPFFNSSLLKSRIRMIFQNRTSRWLVSKYMMVLPVLGLVIFLTAAREHLTTISDLGTKMIRTAGSGLLQNAIAGREQSELQLPEKVEKKILSIKNDTVPGKSVLDRNAYFRDGFRWTENYIYSQMKYPVEALAADIQGKVKVSFIVDENGDIRDAEIVEGLGYGIDEEALRVVQNMPKWHSAIKNGKPVAVRITMGIDFYPALAAGRRKSDIELRNEIYYKAPKVASQVNPFFTISEIGRALNKSLDFSEDSVPKVKFYNGSRLGYMMASLFNVPPITISKDSVEIKR